MVRLVLLLLVLAGSSAFACSTENGYPDVPAAPGIAVTDATPSFASSVSKPSLIITGSPLPTPYTTPSLTPEERELAAEIVNTSEDLRELLDHIPWCIAEIGVVHWRDVKLGAVVSLVLERPLSRRRIGPVVAGNPTRTATLPGHITHILSMEPFGASA
jgi:hypothetical protein